MLRRKSVAECPPTADRQLCASCETQKLAVCDAFKRTTARNVSLNLASLKSSVHDVPARRLVLRERDLFDVIPFLCEGWATSSLALPDGRRQILSFLLPGDIFSTAFLLGSAGDCVIEAITDVQYRTFDRAESINLLLSSPASFEALSRFWVAEKLRADQLALDLGRRSGHGRIARLILGLAERLKIRGMMSGSTMEFPLRQHHIADATGLTAIHVNKVLSEFRRARLIDIAGRELAILDQSKLHGMSQR